MNLATRYYWPTQKGHPVDVETVLKQCEDHLFPVMKMSLRERSIYYHLFRHTRLLGKETGLFANDPLAATLDVSSSIRDDLRKLHDRGCVRIEDKSRKGHLIRVLLPVEIPGVVPEIQPDAAIDINAIDFFSGRRICWRFWHVRIKLASIASDRSVLTTASSLT